VRGFADGMHPAAELFGVASEAVFTHTKPSWQPNASRVTDTRFVDRFAVVYVHAPPPYKE
jgi:hypothetical protein